MRSLPEQASLLLTSILLQEAQMRAAGLKASARREAMMPGVTTLLAKFQDELMDAQRDSAQALAKALNMAGGKQ